MPSYWGPSARTGIVGALLLGIAWGNGLAAPPGPADAPLAWPGPPAEARIRYVKSIATPPDWGITPGAFARLLDAITGTAPMHFVRPTGVVEHAGALFVADPGAASLFIFDAAEGEARQVGRIGKDALASPVAVAAGPGNTVVLADSALRKVFVLDRAGKPVRTIAWDGFSRPAALAYDATADRLYVADSIAHRIAVFSGAGEFLQTFGRRGSGDGEFNSPAYLALTPAGELLVTDALNYRIQAFDRDGHFLWKVGRHGDGAGDFASPKGVAGDREGQLYVVDALFDSVQILSHDGTLLLGFGGRGARAGQFWLPGGLYMDAKETLYVADAYNQRIQVFQRLHPEPSEGRR